VTELDPTSQLDDHAQRAKAAREALVGKTIAGRYVLRGLLGHGGMGAVYEAEHVGLGKRAAIKFVDPEFATDEKVVARFAREARAMSAIESAHIVTVFDAGTEDGRPYLVMELLRGEDLGERLRRLRRIPLAEAMHVVAQVLKGLARAHAAGIVHRDLKPDNVFLVKHDTDPLFAKIVDFGISKIERPRANTHPLALTGRGTVLGTPFYMSPEQAQASSDVDGRTDLYSVGAILFECLTGRPPHTGESYEQVILSICMRDAPTVRAIDPSIPENVSAFVARALSRDRTQRFGSAEGMLAALHEVAPEERTRVPLDPVAEPSLSPRAQMAATMLDGGSPVRSSRPSFDEVSAATRLGVGMLDSSSAPSSQRPDVAPRIAERRSDPTSEPRSAPTSEPRSAPTSEPRSAPTSEPKRPAPAKRPLAVAVATAAGATLTGVGVTFLVISMIGKKPVDPRPPSLSAPATETAPSASAAPLAPPSATASATPPASAEPSADAAPSASSSGRSAPLSTASAKPGTPSSARTGTRGTSFPPLPRPSSTKPLDIQRDLPP
jgi:serine/threonine-protein kinase